MKTLILLALVSQYPNTPDKALPQPGIPSKSTPLASPQVQASPQQSFAPQYDQPAVVLRAVPQIYQVQRQVIVQAAPVAYAPAVCSVGVQAAPIAYASGSCGVGQQAVIQNGLIGHSAVVSHGLQNAVVNHGVVAAGVGRQPKKIKTKQVTRVKRGLFGR